LNLGNQCKVQNVTSVPSQLKRFGGCAFFSLEKIIGWINLTLQLQRLFICKCFLSVNQVNCVANQ
jgi:hypothetical protein